MTDRLRRSSSLCLLIAGGLLAILSARPAEAAAIDNALQPKALPVNGLSVNGLGVNGVKQNGIAPLLGPTASRHFGNPGNVSAGDLRITTIVLRDGHRLGGR